MFQTCTDSGLIDRLPDWLSDCMIDWLTDCLTDWLIDCLTDWLTEKGWDKSVVYLFSTDDGSASEAETILTELTVLIKNTKPCISLTVNFEKKQVFLFRVIHYYW